MFFQPCCIPCKFYIVNCILHVYTVMIKLVMVMMMMFLAVVLLLTSNV